MNTEDPKLIYSALNQAFSVDGHRFEINIISSDVDPLWCLEIVDEHGTSHVWDDQFESDKLAFDTAMQAFQDEGAAGFVGQDNNVLPFPQKP